MPFLYFVGVGIGLIILGSWQLISAIVNTPAFIQTGYKKQILSYWAFWIANLSLIVLFLLFEKDLNENLLYDCLLGYNWSCGVNCRLLLKILLSANRTSLSKK
jgi:hypothetical protein